MRYIIILLLPALLFSQEFVLQDTLYFNSGEREDCFILSVSADRVSLTYAANVNAHAGLDQISQIYVNGLGTVYSTQKGFITPLDDLNNFLSSRHPSLRDNEKPVRDAGSVSSGVRQVAQRAATGNFKRGEWFFGVFYVPFHEYSQKILSYSLAGSDVFDVENSGAMIEARWGYRINPHLYLTLNSGYNQVSVESHFETVDEYSGVTGYDQQDKIKTFYAIIGVKYFIIEPQPNFVAVSVGFGAGKQFAFVSDKFEPFYESGGSTVTIEENREEFLEDINSPWLLELGFCSEYMINNSLSLFARIVIDYVSVSAEHRYRRITQFEQNSSKFDYDQTDFYTRIGFGLNFYF